MLIINDLSKKFRKKEVLHPLDLTLDCGIYGLLGENGAGKTTLLRCIAGLYSDYNGSVSFADKAGKQTGMHYDKIGYLPQEFGGLGELRVNEFLRYFADMKAIDKKSADEEISRALESVNLTDKGKERVMKLSGGMRRRLGIAQTLLGNPELIMYDEPTTGLDPKERLRFQNIIEENRASDVTVIISTHIVSDIECLCDEIIVMKEGHVLGMYTPVQLAETAAGRVYEIAEADYEKYKEYVLPVKKVQSADGHKWRVILEEHFKDKAFEGKKVDSTVEDGYLWVSR
ncbi:ATP-binding cassette domain-containing protein [bacterium 1xD8-6]|nr:ATP-binding cassette domain-containing protein [bacterium D16-36]RKI72872.1 ATP-binding cassette domain-containing protein [bacterium 1xD8-6]